MPADAVPSATPLRIGLVGCGRMGRVHAERIVAETPHQVVALFDPVSQTMQRLAEDLPTAPACLSTFEAFLETEFDAAVISTPTPAHESQVRALEQKGVHLLCEKPLSDSRESIRLLIELADASPHVLSLGYQRRYWSSFRTAARELNSGRFGRLLSVTYHNVERWQQTVHGTWRDDPAVNWGGFVGDAGSHKIDALHFATGCRIAEVHARAHHFGSSVPVMLTSHGLLIDSEQREIPFSFDLVGNASHLDEDFHLHCEQADIMIRGRQVWIARNNDVAPVSDPLPDSNPTVGFCEAVADGAELLTPFAAAWDVRVFTEALLESAETQSVVMPDYAGLV